MSDHQIIKRATLETGRPSLIAGARRSVVPEAGKPSPEAPPRDDKGSGRHGAINSKVHNWQTYTVWVNKVRSSWDEKK
jgi:hypothetical protein